VVFQNVCGIFVVTKEGYSSMEKYTSVSVFKRKKGWQARLRYKENDKWKETSKMLPEATGKKEAEKMAEELRQRLNKIAADNGEPARGKTVDDVVSQFLEHQLNTGLLERSSYYSQKIAYEKNIKPYLGDYEFNTLDRMAIIDWHTQLSQRMTQHGIYYNYTIITKVYNYYVSIGEIDRNPFHAVKGLVKSKKSRVTHLTPEQMEMLLADAYLEFEPEDPMLVGIMLAYYGALRRSEICGLRWFDVDFESNTLTVSSAIGIGEGGTYTKGTKNPSSHRTFPLIPQLRQVLKQRYDAIHPEKDWFVIGEQKQYMKPKMFNIRFKQFVDAYNIVDAYGKPITPHALRHNAASVGVRSGMDISALSLMMGHASRAMTLDTYADASEQSKRIGAERLSATFTKETNDNDFYDIEPKEAE